MVGYNTTRNPFGSPVDPLMNMVFGGLHNASRNMREEWARPADQTDNRESRSPYVNPLDDLFNGLRKEAENLKSNFKSPANSVNVEQDEDKTVLTLVVPGHTEDSIEVEIEEGVLKINANASKANAVAGYTPQNVKTEYAFENKDALDLNKVNVLLANGVLVVTVPFLSKEERKDIKTFKVNATTSENKGTSTP